MNTLLSAIFKFCTTKNLFKNNFIIFYFCSKFNNNPSLGRRTKS